MSDDSFQQMGDFLNVAKSREIIARLNSTKQPASVSTKSESTQNVSEVERYLKRKLGPRDFQNMVTSEELSLPKREKVAQGWARKVQLEQLALKKKEKDQHIERATGPGSYEIKDFLYLNLQRPTGKKGIMDSTTPRFTGEPKKKNQPKPDPATYGVPEVSNKKSYWTKGLLECGHRYPHMPVMASDIAPGTYELPKWPESLLNKVVSQRGPYDLWTAERGDRIVAGFQAPPKLSNLGPGQYEYESFTDKLNRKPKSKRKFLRRIQVAKPKPQTSSVKSSVGKIAERKFQYGKNKKWPAFGSCNVRNDKLFEKRINNNFNSVGIGRYNFDQPKKLRDINGHKSLFAQKTSKPLSESQKLMQSIKEQKARTSYKKSAKTADLHVSESYIWAKKNSVYYP